MSTRNSQYMLKHRTRDPAWEAGDQNGDVHFTRSTRKPDKKYAMSEERTSAVDVGVCRPKFTVEFTGAEGHVFKTEVEHR